MKKVMVAIIVGTSILVGIASSYIFKKTDNVVEEIAEKIIKDETGCDIDLSPWNPDMVQKEYDVKNKRNI